MSKEDSTSEILLQLDVMRCHQENARAELNQAIRTYLELKEHL